MNANHVFIVIIVLLLQFFSISSVANSTQIGDYEIYTLNRVMIPYGNTVSYEISKDKYGITIGQFINGLKKIKLIDKVSYEIDGDTIITQFSGYSNSYDKIKLTYKVIFTLYEDTKYAILDKIYLKSNNSPNFVENSLGPYAFPPALTNYMALIKHNVMTKPNEISSTLK